MTSSQEFFPVRVLGIDPGTRVAGYGVVEIRADGSLHALAAGAWDLPQKEPLAARLATLSIEFRRVVAHYRPQVVCVELPFVSNNARSALVLGTARGVVLSEAHQAGLDITEIAATSAKKIITGNGYAEKERVMRTLEALLGANLTNLPFDATDALAIAYAHALRRKNESILGLPKTSSSQKGALLDEWAHSTHKGRRTLKSFSRHFQRS